MNHDTSAFPACAWQLATLAEAPDVLDLMRDFYAEEGLAFDPRVQGAALDALLSRPELGEVHTLRANGGGPLGHLVLTRAHSLEFGGAFILLDELYLRPEVRGRGEGKRALAFAAARALASGAHALRLEVARANARARAAYVRAGFVVEERDLMTLRLSWSIKSDRLRTQALLSEN